jgi:hypothetical protein
MPIESVIKEYRKRSQDNVVSIVARPRAGRQGAGISAGERNFSLFKNVQTGSGTHLNSYSMDTGPFSLR